MKKWILLLVVGTLVAGFAAADPGIAPAPEIQGLSTHTVIRAFGTFSHQSELEWQVTDDLNGLTGIPPLGDSSSEGSIDVESYDPLNATFQALNRGAVYYTSVYTEDTATNGLGQIGYTKDLDVNTGAMATGQSNIEALKQLVYTGEPGSKVLSDDFILIDGAGNPSTSGRLGLGVNMAAPAPAPLSSGKCICPCADGIIPPFCSHVESGSSLAMSIADVTTSTNGRFIVKSADTPVSVSHDIRVSNSVGKVSAGIDAQVREGRSLEDLFNFTTTIKICDPDNPDPDACIPYTFSGWVGISSTDLYAETTMHEFTSVDGQIVSFAKTMSYTAGTLL